MLSHIWTIFIKDLRTDLRRKENLLSTFFFAVVILLIFHFSAPSDPKILSLFLPGIFWVTFLLSGVLSLSKSFQQEKESASIEALLLCPIDRGTIYLGKFCGNLFFIMVVQLLVIPLFGIFFVQEIFDHLLSFIALSFVASIGFTSLGTLLAFLTTGLRFNEILLPLLLFPLLIPLLLASIKITGGLLAGNELVAYMDWLKMLIGFDLIFLVISYLAFEFVLEV